MKLKFVFFSAHPRLLVVFRIIWSEVITKTTTTTTTVVADAAVTFVCLEIVVEFIRLCLGESSFILKILSDTKRQRQQKLEDIQDDGILEIIMKRTNASHLQSKS